MIGQKRFYVYTHIRLDTENVFYVGKGHGNRAFRPYGRNSHWNNIVAKCGFRVEIVSHFASEQDAFDAEKSLIAECRANGISLCNKTDGGEGVTGHKHSAKTREKISAVQIGRKLSPECKAKLSVANMGHIVSDDTRKKISKTNSGKKRTPAQNAVNSEFRKGKKLTREHAEKIAKSNTGRVVSDATKAKISAAHRGMSSSPETKSKIGAANRGKVRSPEFCARVSENMRKRHQEARAAKLLGGTI